MIRKKTRCQDEQYSGEVRWLAETMISNLHYSRHVINEEKHDEDDKYVLKWLFSRIYQKVKHKLRKGYLSQYQKILQYFILSSFYCFQSYLLTITDFYWKITYEFLNTYIIPISLKLNEIFIFHNYIYGLN